MNLKFVFLGGPSVGKSSIIHSYTHINTNETPTLTAAFYQKKIVVNDIEYSLGIWDTAGDEQYRSIAPIYFRNTVVAFVVIDATNINSDDEANFWLAELSSKCDGDVLMIIVMNKMDLRQLSPELTHRINSLSRKWNSPSFFVSAKTGQGIPELFDYAIKNGSEKLLHRKSTQNDEQAVKQKHSSRSCC